MIVLGYRLPSQPRTALTPPLSRNQARSNILGHLPRKVLITLLRNVLLPPRILVRYHPRILLPLEDGLNITPTRLTYRLAPTLEAPLSEVRCKIYTCVQDALRVLATI